MAERSPREVSFDLNELDGTDPPRRFRKAVMRVGRFVDPVTREVSTFDRAGLASLASATNRWIDCGYKVHFPSRADEAAVRDAKANLGYWSNFEVVGDELVAEVEVLDDAIGQKIGDRIQNVAPGIARDALAATGERFPVVITHVAASTNAPFGGIGGFVSLTLTRSLYGDKGHDRYHVVYESRTVRLTAEERREVERRATELLLGCEVEEDGFGNLRRRVR